MPPRLTEFAARIGLAGLAIAVLLVLLAVQTVRLDGFKLWPLSLQGWKPRAEAAEKTIADIAAAQELARKTARAAREAKEQAYRDIAERIDDNAQGQIDDAMAAAERFIAARGVRAEATGGTGGRTRTCAGSGGAADPARAGGAPELDAAADRGAGEPLIPAGYVLVPADDVRTCTTNTVKAEAARAFVLELEAANQR